MHDVSTRYTILYIYSLDCPHCQEHAPKMTVFQAKMAAKDIKVFAITVERDEKKWQDFITKYHTQNLLNYLEKANKVNFIKQYDTIDYPTYFVLDAQKKIISKHINLAVLEVYLWYLGVK